jgi:F0F1-type ATP synthase assembly protein I
MTNPNSKIGVRVYLTLSFISAIVVGAVVWANKPDQLASGLIWGGITFIVVLVGIATLALTVKDDQHDPNEPRLK